MTQPADQSDVPAPTRLVPAPASAALDGLRGALMGVADAIPGISGGTIALIVGVYRRLVTSIRAIAAAILRAVLLDWGGARARLREAHWDMLVPLVAGIAVAYPVAMVTVAEFVSAGHPLRVPALAVLLGLVLASVQVPWRRLGERSLRTLSVVALGAVVAFVLTGLPPAEVSDPALPLVFAGSMVALCAMILPGVSGSFLLQAMGLYPAVGDAIRSVDVAFLLTFAAGGALGLALFAKVLEWLLTAAHDMTMAALTGLLIGALRALWPWQAADRSLLAPPADAATLAANGGLFLLGAAVVTALTLLGERAERRRHGPADRRPTM